MNQGSCNICANEMVWEPNLIKQFCSGLQNYVTLELRSIKLVDQYVYFVKNSCNCSLSYLNQIEFLVLRSHKVSSYMTFNDAVGFLIWGHMTVYGLLDITHTSINVINLCTLEI